MIILIACVLMMLVGALKLSKHSPVAALAVVLVAVGMIVCVLVTPGLL